MLIEDIAKILVLDFGGQYAHLIARRFRSLGYYSEIANPEISENDIKNVSGIVLSGGPSSVYEKNAPKFNSKILSLDIPVLGLCYGHHLLIKEYGGEVSKNIVGEYGFAVLNKIKESFICNDITFPTQVWMSHSDSVTKLPDGFELVASTKDCEFTVTHNISKKRFTIQFHPEVKDTISGNTFLENFAKICKIKKNWDSSKVFENIRIRILEEAKNKKVLMFLSGGVDSTVSFALLTEALGKERALGLYINNGFMRKNETASIKERYEASGFTNVLYEDFEELFLKNVGNKIDPQEKRKTIGETFLEARDMTVKKLNLIEDEWLLAQGTLYPDIIESGGTKHADVIKTHHNRVEGIKELLEKGLIIEPLKELYKDEVRILGKQLGLDDILVYRHPFPGPGISINLLCSKGEIADISYFNVLSEKVKKIDLKEFLKKDYTLSLLPVKSVGVQGDNRTYNYPVCITIKELYDDFPGWDSFDRSSSYITNTLKEVNRVVFEIYKKKECRLIKSYCKKERLDMIREADSIVLDELKKHKMYNKIFQHLTINLPYASDESSCSIVLRPVVSEDVMTARFAQLETGLLKTITDKIKKLSFVDALYYDITNKPPATFGWE